VSVETANATTEIEYRTRRANPLVAALRWVLASQEGLLLLCIVVLCLYLANRSPVFWTERNLGVLLTQISMVAISAIGMTLLLIAREVDLSVGSMQAFAGVVVMQTLNASENLLIGLAVAILVGVGVGLINAGITLRLGISSFVVTLAMLSIIRGAAYTSTDAAVQNKHKIEAFRTLGIGAITDRPVRIPWPVVLMVVIFVLFYLVLSRTTFGRYIYAVGGNPQAAALSGIPVNLIKTACFVITSVLAAVSAVILIARMNSGQNNAGFGFELQVIGAALLGGASLFGGKGTLVGTILAAVLLGTLNNGITLLKWDPSWQTALYGIVIVIAIFLDSMRRRLTREA
jgi:ribose/xylose/arabinose/galactoside ABC-type transport system permease subunit